MMYGKMGKKPAKKMMGMKKVMGKGATAKAKSGTTKMKATKKAKKSTSMYA
jgi:hypothetical protein